MSASGSHQDLRRALDTALHLPRSVARSAAIESVVQQADATGDDLTARDARLALVSSYSMGGEPLKRFVPFAWLLQRYDADPTFFDENSRDELLWQFKGVTLAGLGHPGVSLAQIESGLADMERHYLAAGQGLAPYLGVRYHFDAHVHGEAASEESYLAWTRAPRTYLSDCEGCEPTSRVAHLNGMSRWADAVSEAMAVLERERNACVEQPQQMITYAMEPLLMTGDPERAAWEHLRAIRLLRPLPGGVEYWARHVLVLARSGRLVRGLDLLEERLHEVDDPPEPDNAMWLAAAGARLLTALAEAGHGDVMVTPRRGGGTAGGTVVEVGERLTRVARDLAVQFDARNGTGTIGAGVEKWLTATELPDLPLDEVATRRRLGSSGAAVPVAPVESADGSGDRVAAASGPALAEQGLAAISEAFRASRDSGSRAQHRASLAAWRAFRVARPEVEFEAESGSESEAVLSARLDAGLALADLADDDGLVEAGRFDGLRQAAARLRELGDDESARTYEMSLLWRRLQAKVAEREQLEAELEALRLEAQDASPAERGALADGALQVMATLGQADEGFGERWAAAVSEALTLMRQGDPETMTPRQRASLARLMMFDSARHEPEVKLAQLRAALALVHPGERAFERANLGMQLASETADTGDFDSAAKLLEEAIADSQIAQEPRQEAELWGMLGRTRNLTEQPQEAVAAFTRAGVLLAENDAPVPMLASIRQDLVYALRTVGRSLEAAELAESALHQLAEYERERGAEPDADEKDSLQRQLGTLAYAAATAALDLGERAHAAELARRSAAWHASTGWVGAEAEAQLLVAQTTEDVAEELAGSRRAAVLYEGEGRWQSAARSRRLSLMAVLSVEGPEAALAAVEAARAALHQATPEEGREQALAWEHLVLTEQSARVLVAVPRLDEALASLEGLDPAYADLGDLQSVGDVVVLRAEILIGLDRAEEALASLTEHAQQAVDAGNAQGARRFGGELARMLDDLGRPDEAEAAWQRYSALSEAG